MFFTDLFLTRGRLPIGSFLMFIGGFSMGSWLTIFHQLQAEQDLDNDLNFVRGHHNHVPPLLLAILIISAPDNAPQRNSIRSTWLKLGAGKHNIKHYFVIGTENLSPDVARQVNHEHLVNGDILLLPVVDSYQNLTVKLTESLTYISSAVPFRYVLKCDDDTFVRVDSIVEELEEREARLRGKPSINGVDKSEQCYFWGFFDGRARAKKQGKWKEGDYNLCDLYLPYALGGGYVMSKKCSDFIVRNQVVLRTYKNEDVTVGTWLSVIVSEKRHDIRFDTEYESRGCSNKYLIQHKITQAEMYERYQNLIKTGKLCPKEFRRRPSYDYDWSVPPSQCCKRNSTII